MTKFTATITVLCNTSLSKEAKQYLRKYMLEAIETMQGCREPDSLESHVFGNTSTALTCKELNMETPQ